MKRRAPKAMTASKITPKISGFTQDPAKATSRRVPVSRGRSSKPKVFKPGGKGLDTQ